MRITDRHKTAAASAGIGALILAAGASVWRGLTAGPVVEPDDRPLEAEIKWAISGHKVKLDEDRFVVYAGVRTPYEHENKELYERALERNAELVNGRQARLRFGEADRDRDGDLLAYVFAEDQFVNEILVREGLAYVRLTQGARRFADRLLAAQEVALRKRRGVWALPTSAPEHEYIGDPKYGNYHRPTCEELTRKPQDRLITIVNKRLAARKGFAPCDKCAP